MLSLIDTIRAGELGELVSFSSCFVQMVDLEDHFAGNEIKAGPVFDMAPYPVNAARAVSGDEPTELISAVGTRHPEAGFSGDFDDTVAATLRFPGNRIAQFVVSYHANTIDSYVVLGTKGSVQVNPGYMFGMSLEHAQVIGEKKSHRSFMNTDQFEGELTYFSDCILHDRDPEPDGEEGCRRARAGRDRAGAGKRPVGDAGASHAWQADRHGGRADAGGKADAGAGERVELGQG